MLQIQSCMKQAINSLCFSDRNLYLLIIRINILYREKEKTMYKKTLLIIISCLTLNNIQITTTPDESNKLVGAALFATTAIGMTYIAKQSQRKQEEFNAQKAINAHAYRQFCQQHQQIPLRLTYTPEWHAQYQKNKQVPLRLRYTKEWHNHNDQPNQAAIPRIFNIPLPEELTIPRRLAQQYCLQDVSTVVDQLNEEKYAKQSTEILCQLDQLYRENNFEEMKTLIEKEMKIPFSDFRSQNTRDFNSSSQPAANKNGTVATKHIFHPVTPLPKKVIFLEVVHGTNGRPDAYGQDVTRTLSQSLLMYAQRMAIEQNAIVHLDVVEWSGKLGPQELIQNLGQHERKEAGIAIAQEIIAEIKNIKDQNKNMKVSIQSIGHSHGCNVINFMAKELSRQDITIDNAVFLASPIVDIQTDNIKETINIFGNLDFTGSMGSLLSSSGKTASLRKESETTIVKNIVLKSDGRDLNHSTIKTAINFLPAIQDYIKKNFTLESDLILDIYDKNKYSAQSSAAAIADEDGFFDAQLIPTPDYQIAGIIDDVYAEDGCDFEARDQGNQKLHESDLNKHEFEKRYGRSLYEEPTFIDKAVSEGESAQVPYWVLQSLEQTQKQSQNIFEYAQKIITATKESIKSLLSTTSSSDDLTELACPLSQMNEKIDDARKAIVKEASFKNKSLIIAQLYAAAQEYDDIEVQMKILQKLNKSFVRENKEMTKWQNYYECLIGRTRSDITKIEDLSPEAIDNFKLAQSIFVKAQTDQEKNWAHILHGYENLDAFAQQAINSAIEQQLKIDNITLIVSEYLQSKATN